MTSKQGGGRPPYAWALAAVGAPLFVLFWTVSEPATRFLDFQKAYYPAGHAIATFQPDELAARIDAVDFVNLPAVALLFAPLALVGERTAAHLFFAAGLAAMAGVWWHLSRGNASRSGPLVALLVLANGPLIYSLKLGNTSHFVLLVLAIAVCRLHQGREIAAGALFGLVGILKLPLLLFGPYFLLRRRWKALASSAAVVCTAFALSVGLLGWEVHRLWIERSLFGLRGQVVTAFNVQSLDTVLARLYDAPAPRDWIPHEMPPLQLLVSRLLLSAVAAGSIRLMARVPASAARDRLEISTVVVFALIASPLTWTHYLCFMLLPWSLYVSGDLGATDRIARRLMIGSIVLASLPAVDLVTWMDTRPGVVWRIAASVWFVGVLFALAALLRSAYRQASHGTEADNRSSTGALRERMTSYLP